MAEAHAGSSRRDFLQVATTGMTAVGAACVAWPFIDQMNPAADTLALATTEVDLSAIEVGQAITVVWRGKPVFIRRRSAEEIAEAQRVNVFDLPDPEPDAARVQKAEWLVMVGVCTHLGCVPLGQKATDTKGDFGGWFAPATGRITTPPGVFARARRRRTWRFPAILSLLTPLSVLAEDKQHEHVDD